jgi:sugar lactone lactonase YvrE
MGAKFVFIVIAISMLGAVAVSQQAQFPKPTELPNPYRLVEGWPTLPATMNGGHWGEVIRVDIDRKGNVWVFHRCFNTIPAGHATCIERGDSNPPILEFDPSGKLLKSFGVGLFAYPHGFTLDRDGNVWASDVNDEATVLGMSARNSEGVIRGQEVLKLSPTGKVLMVLGNEGVAGNDHESFDRPAGVAIAPDGDIFVSDGHYPNKHNSARVVKFDKHGRFLMAWGHKGTGPGEFDEPHDIFIGGSKGRVYVADRRNSRIQVFDQKGKFIAAWKQFGQPSSVFVGKDDTIYVGTSFPDTKYKSGVLNGIMIGSARDGSLKAFIPDPIERGKGDIAATGTSASGIAADEMGNIYAADVGTHNLRKYAKVQ